MNLHDQYIIIYSSELHIYSNIERLLLTLCAAAGVVHVLLCSNTCFRYTLLTCNRFYMDVRFSFSIVRFSTVASYHSPRSSAVRTRPRRDDHYTRVYNKNVFTTSGLFTKFILFNLFT